MTNQNKVYITLAVTNAIASIVFFTLSYIFNSTNELYAAIIVGILAFNFVRLIERNDHGIC